MTRCSLCPNENACIPPDGPCERNGVLFVGEAPGSTENEQALKRPPGLPFIGKTGDEVNRHYLPLAGMHRGAVTFTNAISCFPVSAGGKLDPNSAKDQALLQSCTQANLYPLIERMRPRLIVPLGSFATTAIAPDVDLDLGHGFPVETEWGIPAFPSYHPALGLHSPKQMLYIREDWIRLKQYLRGTLKLPKDPYPNPDYQEVTDESEIWGLEPHSPIAMDTESSREGPFCCTFSQEPGTGRLIRSERLDLLSALSQRLTSWESQILFHNWLYDWPIIEQMGILLPVHRVVDTMARVYHLGNLPQGLKALGKRELGVTMQDFADLVKPFSSKVVMKYYEEAYWEEWEKPEPRLVRDPDTTLWKMYKPQGMKTKLKRFFTDVAKQPNKDVFKAWENWEDHHQEIEARLGPWPGMDIRHVPFELVLPYACRDADITLRLWFHIQKMARLVRRYPQHEWRERAA